MGETDSEVGTFDLTGPLPSGTTLLEASAGTGKTFTVGALVTRYVAEGVRLDEMLVITFGRAASQELRERVREQLVEAERVLTDPSLADPDNALLALLLDGDPAELDLRRRRMRDALASFDAATIATTHQFCQLVLRSLGVAGDTDAGTRLVESLDDLVVEVVDDVYLRTFGHQQGRLPFDRAGALALARAAIGDRQSALAPAAADEPADGGPGSRVAFAQAVRDEVDRRKRRLGILGYDDLLVRLADALEADDAPARQRMRGRWRIVLVDEFQDTDPTQWDVLRRAFHGHATMVLIGDPKQAIYGFRGGDVTTYLAAAREATTRATLATNWRSDAELVRRLQVVLRGAALGDEAIVVRDVDAHHRGNRLLGAPHPSPFRIRQVSRTGFRLTRLGDIAAAAARAHIAADCAADIAELLAARPTWDGRPLRAEDVAVIVGTRDHGLLVQRHLATRGVPSVIAGGGRLFETPAADAWLALLEALDQPHRRGRVRAAALTPFLGNSAASLVAGGDQLSDELADLLRGWALLLRGRGVAALFEAAEERGLSARVLRTVDGERTLTDLRHLAQLLHETSVRERLGLTAILQWCRDERRRAAGTERPRRLDSDAAAVQIVTVHGSKGLQYPVTYLPFAYQSFEFDVAVARYHDEGVRTIDVRGTGRGWAEHLAAHREEESGEELRDLYVALTRAQSQVVAWWAPTQNTAIGGLHRLLFGRQPGTAAVPAVAPVRDDVDSARILALLEELGAATLEVSVPVAAAVSEPPARGAELVARSFDRGVDLDWTRTSYSGLIRIEETVQATAGGVDSEPEVAALDDEPDGALGPESGAPGAEALVSPMAALPAGATFGSLVHGVLEHADPFAPDLVAELRSQVREQLAWWPVDASVDDVAESLVPLHHTPLGPLAGGLTLGQIGRGDRLRELDFELPLAGGDVRSPTGPQVRLRDLAELLRRHLAPDDVLAPYADRLEAPPLGDQPLRGYLAGSIDVVLRVPDGAGHRYVVVDYKTNLLGEQGRPATTDDYAPHRLAEAMLHSHYPLQALLYGAVVHRYLRWRLPDYDPERHLGGVLYLYVRGMCGPETPTTDGVAAGVFSWRPPTALVLELSDLLDGAVPEVAR